LIVGLHAYPVLIAVAEPVLRFRVPDLGGLTIELRRHDEVLLEPVAALVNEPRKPKLSLDISLVHGQAVPFRRLELGPLDLVAYLIMPGDGHLRIFIADLGKLQLLGKAQLLQTLCDARIEVAGPQEDRASQRKDFQKASRRHHSIPRMPVRRIDMSMQLMVDHIKA
jgi:hypothetical protein